MDFPAEDILKIVLAFIAGALLGYEREWHSKPAGLRTMILITVGSAIFSILSTSLINSTHDRIAANIVTGVGFVGGGVIFKEGANLKGITTAATIWTAAAIGMAIGFGEYWLAGASLLFVIITLTILSEFEAKVESSKRKRLYKITFNINRYKLDELKEELKELDVDLSERKLMKEMDEITVIVSIKARKNDLRKVDEFLMGNDMILRFEV